eukprot:405162_1
MTLLLRLQCVICCLCLNPIESQLIYVSKDGNDTANCGQTLQESCGTLRFASNIINTVQEEGLIMVHDGQNEYIIQHYVDSKSSPMWHPCIPEPLSNGYTNMTITFNEQYIKKMDDWFNQKCIDVIANTNKTYFNSFIFETYLTPVMLLTINHLRIDNYNTDYIPFGILGMYNQLTIISCNDCIFKNINFTLNYSAIYISSANIYGSGFAIDFLLNNNIIENVLSSYPFINISTYYGSISMYNLTMIDSTFAQSAIFIQKNRGDLYNTSLNISQCTFVNISSEPCIINLSNGYGIYIQHVENGYRS